MLGFELESIMLIAKSVLKYTFRQSELIPDSNDIP
jgi:hypothetical protein